MVVTLVWFRRISIFITAFSMTLFTLRMVFLYKLWERFEHTLVSLSIVVILAKLVLIKLHAFLPIEELFKVPSGWPRSCIENFFLIVFSEWLKNLARLTRHHCKREVLVLFIFCSHVWTRCGISRIVQPVFKKVIVFVHLSLNLNCKNN